jgi:diguanylate cyclase (GGDEF)-like protein
MNRLQTMYSIFGALTGYFVCHPVVMIIGRKMSESGTESTLSFIEIITAETMMSFSLNMLPWSIAFAVAGALIGLFYGKMIQVQETLRSLSYIDGLTGIANRRHFQESLDHEWKYGSRMNKHLSLIMCDIDFFKSYNDLYGHQAGDVCLKAVATALSETIERPRDLVARYGGEEFAVLLPETDSEGAYKVAEAIYDKVSSLCIPHGKTGNGCKTLTISIGVTTVMPGQDASVAEPISRADEALYFAKKDGRNKIKVAGVKELKNNDFDESGQEVIANSKKADLKIIRLPFSVNPVQKKYL